MLWEGRAAGRGGEGLWGVRGELEGEDWGGKGGWPQGRGWWGLWEVRRPCKTGVIKGVVSTIPTKKPGKRRRMAMGKTS